MYWQYFVKLKIRYQFCRVNTKLKLLEYNKTPKNKHIVHTALNFLQITIIELQYIVHSLVVTSQIYLNVSDQFAYASMKLSKSKKINSIFLQRCLKRKVQRK